MLEMLGGLLLIASWIVLQFVVESTSGFIHILLAGGVILVIRAIALSRWANPDQR